MKHLSTLRTAGCVLALACAPVLASPAAAALSGYYDSVAQITAVLNSKELGDALHQLPVTDIERKHDDNANRPVWEVETQRCSVKVVLDVIAPAGVGRTDYRVSSISACR